MRLSRAVNRQVTYERGALFERFTINDKTKITPTNDSGFDGGPLLKRENENFRNVNLTVFWAVREIGKRSVTADTWTMPVTHFPCVQRWQMLGAQIRVIQMIHIPNIWKIRRVIKGKEIGAVTYFNVKLPVYEQF